MFSVMCVHQSAGERSLSHDALRQAKRRAAPSGKKGKLRRSPPPPSLLVGMPPIKRLSCSFTVIIVGYLKNNVLSDAQTTVCTFT